MMKRKMKTILSLLIAAGMTLSGMDGVAARAEAAGRKVTVKLSKTQVSVKKGKTKTLKIVTKNVKKIVSAKWSSGNKKIAAVSRKGKVTGKKAGSSTVIQCKVKYKAGDSKKVESKKLTCKVTVKKDSMRPTQPGQSAQLSPSTRPVQPAQPSIQPTQPAQPSPSAAEKTNEELYAMAVKDAAIAEEDEIKPLVSLTKQDPLVTWDDQGRVLLCTWHSYPDSYPNGETVTAKWGYIWTFTDKEMAAYTGELRESEDPKMRLRQLIAIPPTKDHSTVTGLWVKPSDVLRPAYQSDPAKGNMEVAFPEGEEVDEAFKGWFDQNILDSYYYGNYPWTRLGYTYDWADNGREYGLTEFLIKKDAQMEVAFTVTTDEYLQGLYDGIKRYKNLNKKVG